MLTKGLIKNVGFQVVVAMVLGALVGAFMGEQATVFAPLGTLFIQLIKMLVIPLVAVAILSGQPTWEPARQQARLVSPRWPSSSAPRRWRCCWHW